MALAALEAIGFVVFLAAALFSAAGSLRWPMAWAILLVYAGLAAIGLLGVSPSLLAERSRPAAGGERADVVLSAAFTLLLYPGTLVASGLERRVGASPDFPVSIQIVALGLFAAGYGFSFWAMQVNAFFTTVVRIQTERGHRVVDRGPYRWVRHPGYAGGIVAHLALPVSLGSSWGLVPATLGCLLLAARIVGEERMLRSGLAGYPDYAARVRWRLVPGVW
jgi:protein-S-isoprenylcysteine O-methyltransferase Ste14